MDSLSLIPLLERTNQIAAISDPERLLEQTLALLMEVCAARAGALYLLDETARTLVCQAGDSHVFGARVALAGSLAGQALRQRRLFHQEGFLRRQISYARFPAAVERQQTVGGGASLRFHPTCLRSGAAAG